MIKLGMDQAGPKTFPSTDQQMTIASDATIVPLAQALAISHYEKITFYHGINRGGEHPELFYRSNLHTHPFPVPKGRFPPIPTKSLRQVHDTPLNRCWGTVAPNIASMLKNRKIRYSAINPVRFFTHGPPGEKEKGTLGPATIWIALHPGTTTVEEAHEASLAIIELLDASGVKDGVVEWIEDAPVRLSGPALMHLASDASPTHHVRRPLTAALGMPISPATKEKDDVEGSVAFFFHENKDKDGRSVDTVLGVSNCHVLSDNMTVDYEYKGHGAPAHFVRVNGHRRFQRVLDEIEDCICEHSMTADCMTRHIIELEARPKNKDPEWLKEHEHNLAAKRAKLAQANEHIDKLKEFLEEVESQWGDIKRRNIGYVHWAPKISVDVEDTKYTKDIATFVADPIKFRNEFKGNVVSLGAKYEPYKLTSLFYPRSDGSTTFRFPLDGEFRINKWVSPQLLANPDYCDSNGDPCLIVMKDGNSTDLTVGRYAGLESYLCDNLGVESIELAIYNHDKLPGPFSANGDSGSLVFDGFGRMVGIIHSGMSKGEGSYITYATPAWWVIEVLKERYPHADFDRTTF